MVRKIATVSKTVWALLFFITLSIGTTFPFILHLGDHLRDEGDSYEFAWAIGFGAYQLTHDPLHLYSGNIYYPFPMSLAYSDSIVPDLILGTPIILLTGNSAFALNVLILLTFATAGLGMYLLVVGRTASSGAGLVAGIMYGFSPYLFDHVAQIPNISIEWAPFAIWAFDRYVGNGKKRWAAGFVVFVVVQVLASFYYAFILGIGIAMYVAIRLVTSDRHRLRLSWLMPVVGFGVLGSLIVAPFVSPYFALERTFGLRRTLDEAIFYSARPANYLAPGPTIRFVLIDPVLRLFGRQAAVFGDSERHLYPGLLIVALALVGIVRNRYQQSVAPALMTLTGVLLSFGPLFHPVKGIVWNLPFTMPYALLYSALPAFAALRAPSRFGALVVMGLAILAGDGLAGLFSRVGSLPLRTFGGIRGQATLLILCACVAIIESLNNFQLVQIRSGATVPAVYSWLASRPVPSATVELPIDDNPYHQSPLSYYSTYHHQPLVNGSRSFIPPGYDELARTIAGFPSPRSIATLQRLGIRYIIVHEAELPMPIVVPPHIPGIAPTAKFGTDFVYQVDGQASPEELQLLVQNQTAFSGIGICA